MVPTNPSPRSRNFCRPSHFLKFARPSGISGRARETHETEGAGEKREQARAHGTAPRHGDGESSEEEVDGHDRRRGGARGGGASATHGVGRRCCCQPPAHAPDENQLETF